MTSVLQRQAQHATQTLFVFDEKNVRHEVRCYLRSRRLTAHEHHSLRCETCQDIDWQEVAIIANDGCLSGRNLCPLFETLRTVSPFSERFGISCKKPT